MDQGVNEIRLPDGTVLKKFLRENYNRRRKVTGLSLSKHYLSMNYKWYKKMGEPRRVEIQTENELKMIKLTPAEGLNGWHVVYQGEGHNPYIAHKYLDKILPVGRYKKTRHKGFIFKLE